MLASAPAPPAPAGPTHPTVASQDKLSEPMKERIDGWRKEHYKKSMLHLKSYKRAQSAFEKVRPVLRCGLRYGGQRPAVSASPLHEHRSPLCSQAQKPWADYRSKIEKHKHNIDKQNTVGSSLNVQSQPAARTHSLAHSLTHPPSSFSPDHRNAREISHFRCEYRVDILLE